jgi:hypothetical protein
MHGDIEQEGVYQNREFYYRRVEVLLPGGANMYIVCMNKISK